MGNYIKLFETHSAYNTYITGGDAILPNVSYCEDQNGVHYNPWVETRVVAKFNVTDTSTEIPIANYMGGPTSTTDGIDEIEIDGVVQPTTKNTYLFGTTGEHTVKYTLSNPTTIVNYGFEGCSDMVNITIPNTVTTIGDSAFYGCRSLTSATIGSGVTTIGNSAFSNCTSLTSVTSLATTAPTLDTNSIFTDNASGRKFYVPAESVNTYKAASGWSDYAADIEAIQ